MREVICLKNIIQILIAIGPKIQIQIFQQPFKSFKMKNKKNFHRYLLLMTFVLLFSKSYSQGTIEKVNTETEYNLRPVRIGVKMGFPNLIGGNLEYVTPLLQKRFSVNVDYSVIKSDWLLKAEEVDSQENNNNEEINFSYLDLGINYYFFKPGKGLYGGIGYNTIKAEATREDMESVEYIDEKHSSIDIKLGAKLGGLFYFRPEIGFSFDPLPKKYDVLIVYKDGSRETRTDDWGESSGPTDILFKGLMANIGFGFAF